ncbi:NAD-dependent epimerase/dehydratase family protein [Clostridium botulinum]|uniref:NAD-dependent epimerase/dehydratase family protein n=1 Tax=Clostridium botulinum TaxID=1491 RepID=UPI000772E9D4|nr:NAD(P)-dependent oxidoreductase [Clostridium botulinum]
MKKVLVTGASGFIGYKTLNFLINKGYEVHALTTRDIDIFDNSIVKWYKINLLNNDETEKIVQVIKPNYILHFAWYAVPEKYSSAKENLDWVQSSIQLLKSFKKYGGERFIFAGTCFQYDLGYGLMDENVTPSIPNSLYGICKNSFENMARQYCCKNGMSFVSGRIFYLYGERENKNRIIPYVINSLLNGKIANCSHGNQIRDFMHVDDVANAFVEILDSSIDGVINIGSGQAINIKEILFKVGEKLNKKELINLGAIKTSSNEPKMIVANNDRLKNETNWSQCYSLERGIEKTIDWWKEMKIENGI